MLWLEQAPWAGLIWYRTSFRLGYGRAGAGVGIDDDKGRRPVRIVRRDSRSVMTWRQAQMVLLSAQRDGYGQDREGGVYQRGWARDVTRNFNKHVSMNRHDIICRNNHGYNERLRQIVARANIA